MLNNVDSCLRSIEELLKLLFQCTYGSDCSYIFRDPICHSSMSFKELSPGVPQNLVWDMSRVFPSHKNMIFLTAQIF